MPGEGRLCPPTPDTAKCRPIAPHVLLVTVVCYGMHCMGQAHLCQRAVERGQAGRCAAGGWRVACEQPVSPCAHRPRDLTGTTIAPHQANRASRRPPHLCALVRWPPRAVWRERGIHARAVPCRRERALSGRRACLDRACGPRLCLRSGRGRLPPAFSAARELWARPTAGVAWAGCPALWRVPWRGPWGVARPGRRSFARERGWGCTAFEQQEFARGQRARWRGLPRAVCAGHWREEGEVSQRVMARGQWLGVGGEAGPGCREHVVEGCKGIDPVVLAIGSGLELCVIVFVIVCVGVFRGVGYGEGTVS